MGFLFVPGLERSIWDSTSPSPDTELSVTLSGKPSRRPFSWRGWKTRPWISRLSGTISRPSMAATLAAASISCLLGCRASRTPSPASARGTRTSAPSGPNSCESSESVNLELFSSKTCPPSPSSSSPSGESFEDWVSSGLRLCFTPPASPVRRISEGDSLPLLPTPSASTCGTNRGGSAGRTGPARPGLETLVSTIPTHGSRDWKDGACRDANVPTNALLGRWVTRLPTPTANDSTPTANDSTASGAAGYSTASGRHSGTTLTDAVTGAASEGRSGILNPRLSEWLQGLPIGWTESAPLETSALLRWSTHAHSSLLQAASRGERFRGFKG